LGLALHSDRVKDFRKADFEVPENLVGDQRFFNVDCMGLHESQHFSVPDNDVVFKFVAFAVNEVAHLRMGGAGCSEVGDLLRVDRGDI